MREIAARIGLRPTKTLGQNFVIDPNTVRRIVRLAGVGPSDVVVEVGPGLGSLTLALLGAVARVVAVEVDSVLAAALPETVSRNAPDKTSDFVVIRADAVHMTPDDLPGPPATALVANLPYNVAVPVLLHVLDILPSLRTALVMVQAEVAERLAAAPGSRVYGAPSVKARWYAEVRRVGSVPRSVFWPEPRVDSGLVRLDRRRPPAGDRSGTFAVVDAAFGMRRKTLRAALAGWAGGVAEAERILRKAGVDPSVRGEQLDVADFARIADARDLNARVSP